MNLNSQEKKKLNQKMQMIEIMEKSFIFSFTNNDEIVGGNKKKIVNNRLLSINVTWLSSYLYNYLNDNNR